MPAPPINLFTIHSRKWQRNNYVYPVISRRSRGLSVGVNLNPDKVCNFDCVYCCVDRSNGVGAAAEIRDVDMAVLREELSDMLDLAATGALYAEPPFDHTPEHLRRLNDVAFSGDGEPTSFKDFAGACELAAGLLTARNLNHAKIVVITNATLLQRPSVAKALEFLDHHNGEIWAKLDAGTEEYYRLVERTSIPLQRVLDNILAAGRARPIVIQTLFMKIDGAPPPAEEIEAYVQRLVALRDAGCRVKLVQVYTIARTTAEAYVTPLDKAQVDAIAARVDAIGLPCAAFYGPS